MLNYIKGKIAESKENLLILETGGIGYELNVSSLSLNDLLQKNGDVKVYTYLQVREDNVSLFGFSTIREKNLFLQLIDTDGVGPKLAISLLSGISVEQFVSAVIRDDANALSSIKGIGKKTAQKIIFNIKDKIKKDYSSDGNTDEQQPNSSCISTISANEEAVIALMTLGYSRAESITAISRVQKDGLTLEELIFNALKNA